MIFKKKCIFVTINILKMYENKIFKRDACDEVSLLHPRHRFAKTRTRRGGKAKLGLSYSTNPIWFH
jgi:hypothetical protein